MTSERIDNNSIQIKKCFSKGVGWVATAEYYKEGKYWKTKIVNFLNTEPINEEEKQKNYRKKSSYHKCVFPKDYSGLVISSSQYEGTRCERWYWLIKNGEIVKNAETLEKLIGEENEN